MNATAAPVAVLEGVHRKVEIGFTISNGLALWSVDIATHIDGVTVIGTGRTLEEAAWNAQSILEDAASAEAERA